MSTSKKVSLKDIADSIGVSTALVSFVLNGRGKEYRVGEETSKLILKTAKEMNYQPNQAAKSLRSGRSKALGVILSDISNPFFATIARHIEDEAEKKGYTALFASSDEDAGNMERSISSLLNKGVDGLIVVPCENSEEYISRLVGSNTPIVLLDRYFPDINACYVALNNFNATYTATIHLIDKGYKKPAMVAYDVALAHMKERIRGYKQAMEDRGLAEHINIGFLKYNSTRKTPDKLVPKMIESGVDALLFATNMISLACLHVINDNKYDVPNKLGLMGFDGNDAFDFFRSPLSYIKQPIGVLVHKAVEIIVDNIAHGNVLQSVLIDGELVVRDSTDRRNSK